MESLDEREFHNYDRHHSVEIVLRQFRDIRRKSVFSLVKYSEVNQFRNAFVWFGINAINLAKVVILED